jgi:hypothetical protein
LPRGGNRLRENVEATLHMFSMGFLTRIPSEIVWGAKILVDEDLN